MDLTLRPPVLSVVIRVGNFASSLPSASVQTGHGLHILHEIVGHTGCGGHLRAKQMYFTPEWSEEHPWKAASCECYAFVKRQFAEAFGEDTTADRA